MKIDRIYTRNVVGTSRETSLPEAAAMMRKFHVGTLLVMGEEPEQETVIGIVTDRDIVIQANGAIAGILSADDVVDGLATDLASLAKVLKSEIRRESEEYGGARAPS
jgi:CBS domain-containing protein